MSTSPADSANAAGPVASTVVSLGDLELRLQGDLQSPGAPFMLRGCLTGSGAGRYCSGGSLLIRGNATGLVEEVYFAGDGGFSQPLALALATDSSFLLALCDDLGNVTATAPITHRLLQSDRPLAATDLGHPTLPRDLAIEVKDPAGKSHLQILAPAGTALPAEFSCVCRTIDQCGRIVVPLWQSSRLLHQPSVDELDPQLPVGATVDISLQIEASGNMTLKVLVRQAGRGQTFQFPPPVNPTPLSPQETVVQEQLDRLLIGYPPPRHLTQLVKKCLFEAAHRADRTGQERESLFAQVYAVEAAAEQARADMDTPAYRESFQRLKALATEWQLGHRDPQPSFQRELERRPAMHDLADELGNFHAYQQVVLAAAELMNKQDVCLRLKTLQDRCQGLAGGAKSDSRGSLVEIRRALAEVAGIERSLTAGRMGTTAALDGMLEGSAGAW